MFICLLIFMVLGKNSDGQKKIEKKKETKFSLIRQKLWWGVRFKESGPKKGPGVYGREIR